MSAVRCLIARIGRFADKPAGASIAGFCHLGYVGKPDVFFLRRELCKKSVSSAAKINLGPTLLPGPRTTEGPEVYRTEGWPGFSLQYCICGVETEWCMPMDRPSWAKASESSGEGLPKDNMPGDTMLVAPPCRRRETLDALAGTCLGSEFLGESRGFMLHQPQVSKMSMIASHTDEVKFIGVGK